MAKTTKSLFQTISERWFLLEPTLFAVYCSHQMSPNKALHCVMRTGQGRIEYNPDIVVQLDHQREHHRDHASAETQRHGNTICP